VHALAAILSRGSQHSRASAVTSGNLFLMSNQRNLSYRIKIKHLAVARPSNTRNRQPCCVMFFRREQRQKFLLRKALSVLSHGQLVWIKRGHWQPAANRIRLLKRNSLRGSL
jgi:hypothetical protein